MEKNYNDLDKVFEDNKYFILKVVLYALPIVTAFYVIMWLLGAMAGRA